MGRGTSPSGRAKAAQHMSVREIIADHYNRNSVKPEFKDIGSLVPDWVLDKLGDGERYAWSVGDSTSVKRETEKALLLERSTDYGNVSVWVPKSVMQSPEEMAKHYFDGKINFDIGAEYNSYLRQMAQHNSVKLGNSKRTEAISRKLEKAGHKVMSKSDFADSTNLPDWFVLFNDAKMFNEAKKKKQDAVQ